MLAVAGFLLINFIFANRTHGKLYFGLNIFALSFVFLSYVVYLILSALDINIFTPLNPDPGPSYLSSINDVSNLIFILKPYY
jgi:hypothetical protein